MPSNHFFSRLQFRDRGSVGRSNSDAPTAVQKCDCPPDSEDKPAVTPTRRAAFVPNVRVYRTAKQSKLLRYFANCANGIGGNEKSFRRGRDGTLAQCLFGMCSISSFDNPLASTLGPASLASQKRVMVQGGCSPMRPGKRRLGFSVSQTQDQGESKKAGLPSLDTGATADSSQCCDSGSSFNFCGSRPSPAHLPISKVGGDLSATHSGFGKSCFWQVYPLSRVSVIEAPDLARGGRRPEEGRLVHTIERRVSSGNSRPVRRREKVGQKSPAKSFVLRGVSKGNYVTPQRRWAPAKSLCSAVTFVAAIPTPLAKTKEEPQRAKRPMVIAPVVAKKRTASPPPAQKVASALNAKEEASPIKKAPEDPYEQHPINLLIKQLNRFAALTHNKDQLCPDLKAVKQICAKLGIGRKLKVTADSLRSRESLGEIKEALLRILLSTLNRENDLSDPLPAQTPCCFVGLGNNPGLVKSVMKERWWWGFTNEPGDSTVLWTQWRKMSFIRQLKKLGKGRPEETELMLCNHLEGNYCLGNKKGLFYCMKKYYAIKKQNLWDILPLTFHIRKGKEDPEFSKFLHAFASPDSGTAETPGAEEEAEGEDDDGENQSENSDTEKEAPPGNVWIVKPGENTNRGTGILVSQDLKEIENYVSDPTHSYIIQKYIERPLLYKDRKFDIRCFGLITSTNGCIKGYFYPEGYVRTSSKPFTLDDLSRGVHLTNEAVQINYNDFGKFEAGNKVSYGDLQTYLSASKGADFAKDIVPKIKVRSPIATLARKQSATPCGQHTCSLTKIAGSTPSSSSATTSC